MKNYKNEEIEFSGCPGCAYGKHEFELPCGMAYEDEYFTMSQDWELPIIGFFVLSPKRHVEKLEELSEFERNKMFEIVNTTIKSLRDNNICERFDVVFEEKENVHFHVWIMPRHKWMKEKYGDIITNVGSIFAYAKANYRNDETFNKIVEVTELIKKYFN